MVILGIEAAAKACGCAIYKDGIIASSVLANAGMTHSETLMPMVDQALAMARLSMEDVDYIALTNGPGSFTGLRIGAATAKGLALGANKPLIPVNTLESLTFSMAVPNIVRIATMDARRHQVYTAGYQLIRDAENQLIRDAENQRIRENAETKEAAGRWVDQTVIEPQTISPEELLEKLQGIPGTLLFMGDAVDLYESFFRENLGDRYLKAPAHLKELSAASTCSLAALLLENGRVQPIPSDRLAIEYLRKPQAEREREERLRQQQ